MKIFNPTHHTLIQEVSEDTIESLQEKVRASALAQTCWKLSPLQKRIECIARFRDLLIENTPKLASTLSDETGKPISQARNELKATPKRIDFFMNHVEKAILPEDFSPTERVTLEPLGVVANISAWNYPYFVGTNVFIPALLTGNTVLYKPSEFSTLTGLHITELMHQAGIPKDVFAPVIGGASIGNALLGQDIQAVFFTGSYATGVKINQSVSGKLIRTQLELGGKDPIYVLDDVDVAKVAPQIADGAFYNTGQSCCSVERIYVHKSVYGAFVDHFVKNVQTFKIGDPSLEDTYIGPLTRDAQIPVLEAQCKDALSKGAKCLTGGKRSALGKNFFEPTVFTNVNHQMRLMREESFGPIIGIQQVSSDEEAITLMNDTEYGLTAGVYSKNRERASGILSQINSGTVYWNCCDRVNPILPWTGRKHSGIGSTLSMIGIKAFTQPKAWHFQSP